MARRRSVSERSYGQFCGIARGLDVLGERWTLLILRELLLGARRFGELGDALEGIGPNLLAARLRRLAAAGLVETAVVDGASRYRLHPDAEREVEAMLMALGRFGQRFLDRPRRGERVDLAWAVISSKRRYRGGLRDKVIAFETTEGRVFTFLDEGAAYPRVRARAPERADVVVRGDEAAVRLWLFAGVREGVTFEGDAGLIAVLQTAFR